MKWNKLNEEKKVKAIIVAAGQGSRLMPITNDKPKCLLEVKGKTVMQPQWEGFWAVRKQGQSWEKVVAEGLDLGDIRVPEHLA